jgi:hypothetical protein
LLTRSLCAILLAASLAACSQAAPGAASPTASPSPIAAASPTLEPTTDPSPTPTVAPSPTPEPSPTPTVKPSPTQKPWLTFESKEFRYSIKYPSTWRATPSTPGYSDSLDDFAGSVVFIDRDELSANSTVSLKETALHEIELYKSGYKAKLLSEEIVPFKGGWKGRLMRLAGYEDATNTYFQLLLVGKNRIGYFVEWRSIDDDRAADDALFEEIYTTFKPRT